MKNKKFGLLSVLNLLMIAALGLAACAQATPASTATAIPSITPTTSRPTVPPPPPATATAIPIPATSTQPPQATAVPATPTSVPTVATDPNRPNDLTEARLRVSQCVPNEPDMDIYINGKIPVVAGVPLTYLPAWQHVSRYEYLAPGTVSVAVVPTGMGLNTPTPLLAPLDVTLEAGHRYTVVVLGQAEDPSHKALVIDETGAYQKAGGLPNSNSAGHITVNNVKDVKDASISFLHDGVGEKDVPFLGFGASVYPTGKYKSLIVSVGKHLDYDGAGWTWPGVDTLDCIFGLYKGPTNGFHESQTSARTSGLNMIEFLQGFSDQHGKNSDVPSFDTFLAAVKTAGLTDLLTSAGPHLIFAPTDKAFASLPKDQLDALMADPKALGDFLSSYIVEGYYPPYTLGGDVDGDNFNPDRTVINLLGKELVLSSFIGSISHYLSINGSNMEDFGNSMIANGSRVFLVQNLMKPEGK